jgi:3-phenylpropionate/trans-cinnamate dioxygenase ferredoxin subunit
MLFESKIKWYKIFDSPEAAERMIPKGKVTTLSVGKKKLCIANAPSGFYAVNDKCPHNGASLGNGYCTNEGSVVCPVHRYHFDLETGRAKSGLGDVVQTYPIKIDPSGVFVGLKETVWNLF